jgi:hypothetical protein
MKSHFAHPHHARTGEPVSYSVRPGMFSDLSEANLGSKISLERGFSGLYNGMNELSDRSSVDTDIRD